MNIRVDSVRVRTDPDIPIFRVELGNGEAVWPETFGSEHDLEVFLRGVKATYAIVTGNHLPDIFVPKPDTGLVVRDDHSARSFPGG